MSLTRSWYISPVLLTLTVALTVWACGDSGSTTEPTPTQQKPVASVTVAPLTGTVEVSGTQKFTATLFDASGGILTGRTVTWSSSSQSVGTVSQSGLVTAAGVGEATITATSEGRSGSATFSVTQPLPPGVVATGTIGAAGGSIETPDVGLSIAAGQLSASTQIQILSSSDPMEEFGSDLATGVFRLQGFPQDREVEVRVRLRTTAPLREQSFIGMGVPVIQSSIDTYEEQPGLVLREATDSAGYLVATMPVRGRGVTPGPGPSWMASTPALDSLADGLISGVTGVKSDSVPGGKFVIVSFGAPRAELTPMVTRIAKLIEDSRVTLEGMDYSSAHRTQWPMQVRVHPIGAALGGFTRRVPWPLDVNKGYFKFNTKAFARPDIPGIAIHEFYHFLQARYTEGFSLDQEVASHWVKEGASTWVMEKAPEALGVPANSIYQGWRDGFFMGLHPGLTAKHGYGKAPLFKYVADRWGDDQVKKIFDNVKAGKPAVDAVLSAIPEAPAIWWPDLLTKYMKGEIYSLDPDSLPQRGSEGFLEPGVSRHALPFGLRPFGAEFMRFTPTAGGYGTGTKLTVRLPSDLHTAGTRLLPFRKDESGKWEEQGGVADSLVIEGADLNLGREYGLYLINTAAPAPYTQSWSTVFQTDLGYAEGDWYLARTEVLNDAITYNRGSQADTVTIDVASDAQLIFLMLTQGGIWKRAPDPDAPNLYIWVPTAEFGADLAEAKATALSYAFLAGDTLMLNATFDIDPPVYGDAESGNTAALGGACLLLLAGLAMRRKRQMVLVAFAGAFGLALWGCDLGFINLSAKYRYEFKFTDPALTASLEDPTVPLVHLQNGTGTVFIDRYRAEFWEYIRDAEDVIVDSVAVAREASGQATVKLEAMLIQDGALDEDGIESMLRASGVLRGPISAVPEAIRARIRR